MHRIDEKKYPYIMFSCILIIFTIFAFTQQAPRSIMSGLIAINMTRGVLITDYIEIGGIGAAFIDGVIVSIITIIFLVRIKIIPTGATIMSLFLTFGFAMFGKNILNMLPITLGVWLYAKAKGKPYKEYYTIGLLAATISPVTSEILFLDIFSLHNNIILGVSLGILSGFLFPMVSKFVSGVFKGYNLYNMGFVGGILATFIVAILMSLGIEVEPAFYISSGNNRVLGILLIIISIFLIIWGVIFGNRKKIISDLLLIMKCPGTLPSDYYVMFGANVYINMGLLCLFSTAVVQVIGADLNGPTIAGILTITGFGAFGKHFKNVVPVVLGAIIATIVNKWDITYTPNVLGILFSTGISPIAGKYGIIWGIVIGFLHVCIIHHIGGLCNGLNLYNNGFAAGFVVILMVPIIEGIKKLRNNKTL